jgi:hypothetical protein
LVDGIQAGAYLSRPSKNADFALNAVNILPPQPKLASDKKTLWQRSYGSSSKQPNGQMELVLGLWAQGLLA